MLDRFDPDTRAVLKQHFGEALGLAIDKYGIQDPESEMYWFRQEHLNDLLKYASNEFDRLNWRVFSQ